MRSLRVQLIAFALIRCVAAALCNYWLFLIKFLVFSLNQRVRVFLVGVHLLLFLYLAIVWLCIYVKRIPIYLVLSASYNLLYLFVGIFSVLTDLLDLIDTFLLEILLIPFQIVYLLVLLNNFSHLPLLIFFILHLK